MQTSDDIDEPGARVRLLKEQGFTDLQIAHQMGTTEHKIRVLRKKHGIPGLPNGYAVQNRSSHAAHPGDGWPEVLDAQTRDRRWAAYFAKMGRDHSADDLRFRPSARKVSRPDISHLHGLGATSLQFL